MGAWQTNPNYITQRKQPRALTFDSPESEFYQLVYSVSKELNPASVLYELERIGAVKKQGRRLHLVQDTFTPNADLDTVVKLFEIDCSVLTKSVEENAVEAHSIPNLHARTEFDRIRPEKLVEIRAWLVREGHELHRRAREFLSQYDQDITPDPEFAGPTSHVQLGTFSLVETQINEEEHEDT